MRRIGLASGEIVKRHVGCLDDMPLYKWGPFRCALLRAFHAAFPFKNCPTLVPRLREETEYALEIDLAIPRRPESSGAARPGLVPSVDAHATGWPKLGVLHVKT